MAARFTLPDERIDAVRGRVALERGPLVYCFEQADLPAFVALDDVELDLRQPPVPRPADASGLPLGTVSLGVDGFVRTRPERVASTWPYRDEGVTASRERMPVKLTANPYWTWANRDPGSMRVWAPIAPAG
jgi:uncharacterized protein